MNSIKERILDLELEEVVGGRTPPDLEERIMAATLAMPTAGRKFSLRPALAAAAVLLIAAGLFWASTLGPAEVPTPPPPPLLTAEQEVTVDAWIALIRRSQTEFDLSDPEQGKQVIAILNAKRELRLFMEDHPEAFPAIRERLVPLPGTDAPADLLIQTLEVLARGPAPEEDPEVLRLVTTAGDKLTVDLLVTLAERKVVPAREHIAGLLTEGRVDPGMALVAAYFGLRGDARGEEELRQAVARPPMPGMMPGEYVVAAAALYRLGDPAPWRDAVALARARVKQYGAMGRAMMAAELVVNLVHMNPSVAAGTPVPIGDIMVTTKDYWMGHLEELKTGKQLHDLLDSLAK